MTSAISIWAAASGVPYRGTNDVPPHPDEYAAMVKQTLGDLGCRLVLEPGRMITGNAGILVSRVIYVKSGEERDFIIQDAAMNDLIRPTLYDAYHEILPGFGARWRSCRKAADVVGPVCEFGRLSCASAGATAGARRAISWPS